MDTSLLSPVCEDHYELSYLTRIGGDGGYSFGCDAQGTVDMNAMTERARNNYLYARAVVGIELQRPTILKIV